MLTIKFYLIDDIFNGTHIETLYQESFWKKFVHETDQTTSIKWTRIILSTSKNTLNCKHVILIHITKYTIVTKKILNTDIQ
jgi:hypothetical protein